MEYLQALHNRRTIYSITDETTIPDEQVTDIVQQALRDCPTHNNSQSSCAVVLLGKHHKKLWDIVMETLRKQVPPEKFGCTEKKIDSFAAGHGTILYFDDTAITQDYVKNVPLYKDNFPLWAQQQNGMLQFAIWTALEENGLGASLQHYNPLIDDEVRREWNLPESWQLIAQMPFGKPYAPPQEKEWKPREQRLRLFLD